MSELNKRILSSVGLIIVLFLAIYNFYILSIVLFIFFLETYNEIYLILKKIFKKEKVKLYLSLIFSLIYLLVLIFVTWSIFVGIFLEFKPFLLAIITICISSDVGGYLFGKIIGGKKLSKISPNKTYSGSLGSYILSLFFTFFLFNNFFSLKFIVLFAIIVSTISQIGDLSISILKRKAKIKDTGKIIPGHGGLLDRFDGLIFAIPLGLFILKFI